MDEILQTSPDAMNVKLPRPIEKLLAWSRMVNIATELDEQTLARIGQKVVEEYEIDETSRVPWMQRTEQAMKCAQQIMEEKTHPWPGAANVKYPLITVGAIQFAARAYPEIIKGSDVVKCQTVGSDENGEKTERANRVSKHMSWQCTKGMEYWERETDRLLHYIPTVGQCFRKTYWDALDQNIASRFITADKLCYNYRSDFETTRRKTEILDEIYPNEIYENVNAGVWLKQDFGISTDPDSMGDDDAPHTFLEQHRWWDLDGDGYQEPYAVTVHKETAKVVRIVARYDEDTIKFNPQTGKIVKIEAVEYYTHYGFVPSLDGSGYDIGFGALLYSLNETVNTVVNQLLDAGSLANRQGGFLDRGLKFGRKQAGQIDFTLGEWKPVETVAGKNIRDCVFPIPVAGPSTVLFQLLELLVQASKDITSVQDIMSGQAPGANVPVGTVMAQVEQGLKVFSAIYKRIYRSLGQEFKKIYRLNAIYLNPTEEFTVLDDPQVIYQRDYSTKDLDVAPVADPSMSSDVQRLLKAQALLQISGRPGLNEPAITSNYLDALHIPNKAEIFQPPDPNAPPRPDPLVMDVQSRHELGMGQLQLKQQELALKAQQLAATVEKLRADSILSVSRADVLVMQQNLEKMRLFVESLDSATNRMHELRLENDKHTHEHLQASIDRDHESTENELQRRHEIEKTRKENASRANEQGRVPSVEA